MLTTRRMPRRTVWIPSGPVGMRHISKRTSGEEVEGPIVFAGYGLEVPGGQGEDGKRHEEYSSYFHLDVEGKWVLLLRYMPEDLAPELRRRYARFSNLRYKALIARQKGARGIRPIARRTFRAAR